MIVMVFKTSVGFNKVPGGFDSHPPPPLHEGQRMIQPAFSLSDMGGAVRRYPSGRPALIYVSRTDLAGATLLG